MFLLKFLLCVLKVVISLPDDKILALSKLKAFADDKINLTQTIKFVFPRTENMLGKTETAVYLHLLLFPQRFQRVL